MNTSLARSILTPSSCLSRTQLASRPLLQSARIASPLRTFTSSRATMVQAIESYDQFKKLISQDKVVAVDFWATWCGPCKMISPLFDKFAGEAPADKIEFYKVDVDEQEQISQECGIKAMPTFVFFKGGEKVGEVVGANPPKLQAAIKEYSS